MVQPSVEKDIPMVAGKLGEVTIKVAVNPLELASELHSLYVELRQAAEVAGICREICKDIADTICNMAPVLCDLLSVGALFPEDNQRLNESLQRCLSMAVRHIQEAVDAMYEYLQHSWWGQLRRAEETKDKLERTYERVKARRDDIHLYVSYATNVQVRQGLQIDLPEVVEAVEGLRRQLQALQDISAGDSARVRAIAAAAVKRCSQKGQKIDLEGTYFSRVAVSPDGEMFVTTGGTRVEVWEAATGKLLHRSPEIQFKVRSDYGTLTSVAWSPDGSFLASYTYRGLVVLWKVSASACKQYTKLDFDYSTCRHGYSTCRLAWSSAATMLAATGVTSDEEGREVPVLQLWSVPSGVEVKPWKSAPAAHAVAWSPDGTLIAILHKNSGVKFWSTATFELEREFPLEYDPDYWGVHMQFSPDGRKLAFFRTINAWVLDVSTGAWETLKLPQKYLEDLAWRPNGLEIAIATRTGIFLYDAATLSQKRVIYDSSKWMVQNIAWSPCSKLLYCALLRLDPYTSAVRVFRADVEQ